MQDFSLKVYFDQFKAVVKRMRDLKCREAQFQQTIRVQTLKAIIMR